VLSPKSSSLYSPLGRVLLSAVTRATFRQWNRPPGIEDESVDSFLTRCFGSEFARIFGSAFVHGIYAADSRELSVRAAFPFLWDAEERGRGSVPTGFLRLPRVSATAEIDDIPYQLGDIEERMRGVSVYSFSQGIGTLVSALLRELRSRRNVHVLGGVSATALRMNKRTGQFEVRCHLKLVDMSEEGRCLYVDNNFIPRDSARITCCLSCASPEFTWAPAT